MPMLEVANTLSEALPKRTRAGAIGLVLGLDGSKYYVFRSHQSREGVTNSMVRTKIGLHEELLRMTSSRRRQEPGSPDVHGITEGMVGLKVKLHEELLRSRHALSAPTTMDNAERQAEFLRINPTAQQVATQTAIEPEGRHAEEQMIEQWAQVRNHFVQSTGKAPKAAQIFLSHCPCQPANQRPSSAKTLAGVNYPLSCKDKLLLFCRLNERSQMKWNVYYDSPFEGKNVNVQIGDIKIEWKPHYL